MATEVGSALTLQATRSWAVELATCLADEMSFSSLPQPWDRALAALHRFCVAAATRRAFGEKCFDDDDDVDDDDDNNDGDVIQLLS